MPDMNFSEDYEYAKLLDADDEMGIFRGQYVIADSQELYMDGNSLGRMPRRSLECLQRIVEKEWGHQLIRSWGQGWYDAPQRVGEKIAGLIGAAPGQVIVCDSTSVNLYKLVMAALALRPDRMKIVSDTMNFPSDLYILQGCITSAGACHKLHLVPSLDGVTLDLAELFGAIDEDTALVTLSHVAYKSGFLYDAASITAWAEQKGALVLWDLSHSVGAVPIELDRWGAHMAVGCTYKYLNGGPGAPAFLYVNKGLQTKTLSPVWGWFGERAPFYFEPIYQPAEGVQRFMSGTPPILSLLVMEQGVDLALEAGIERVRKKSLGLTNYFISLFDIRLHPLGFTLGTPRDPAIRGSHVSLRHPSGYQVTRALIEEMRVIPDFREPDNIRFGLSAMYTTYSEVWDTVERIYQVINEERFLNYPATRLSIT